MSVGLSPCVADAGAVLETDSRGFALPANADSAPWPGTHAPSAGNAADI
jgi:hypothetical protein